MTPRGCAALSFCCGGVPALWSSNYIIARAAIGVVAPHVLALGRWSSALALMLPFVARELIRTSSRWRGEWPQMLVLGALGMWVCGAFVYLGGQTTSAWPASPPAAWPCCCRSR